MSEVTETTTPELSFVEEKVSSEAPEVSEEEIKKTETEIVSDTKEEK